MHPTESKKTKQLSPWIIAALSLVSFAITLVLSVYITFTLSQFTDKEDNASAFILCFISSMTLLMLAFATRAHKISLLPAILGGVLMTLSLPLLTDVIYKNYFEGFRNSNPVAWVIYAVLLCSPVFAIAILEMRRTGQAVAWKVAVGAGIVVPVLLLATVAIPTQNQAAQRASERGKEIGDNVRRARELEREDNELQREREQIAGELKDTAFKTVQDISRLANQSQSLPASLPTRDGYEFSEYTVVDIYKVRFCMRPAETPYYNIGAIVDWSARTGTMFWLSDVTGGNKCNYENPNLTKLSE